MQNIWRFDHTLAYIDCHTGDIDDAWSMNAYYGSKWKQDLTVPTLPPPKRILKPYSRIQTAPHIFYEIVGETKQRFRSEVRVNKYHNLIKDENKLRLLRIGYYFIRDKNAMSERRSIFYSLVYNTKTKALYVIKPEAEFGRKKNGDIHRNPKWNKKIVRIGVNNVILQGQLHTFKREHLEWFIKDMKKHIQEEIPDVSDACEEPWNRLIALNIQHRVGKAIPNINDNFLDNLSAITRPQTLEMLVNEKDMPDYSDVEGRIRVINKLKRDHTYKFMPVLTETHSVKKAIKAVLGEWYHNIHSKTIFNVKWEEQTYQPFNLWRFGIYTPKSIQHYISKVCKNLKSEDDWEYLTKLIRETLQIINTYVQVRGRINKPAVNSWIKTVRRLNTVIDWGTWKDIYYMASQIGIRIRPNRFTSLNDVMEMHDTLSVFRRRNRMLLDDIEITDDTKFIEVVYPKDFMTYKFKQLLTPAELREEHDKMGHCIHSYDRQCVYGHSIIFSAKGPNGRYWTIELGGREYEFIQAEGAYSDNNGKRFFCPREIITEIFVPFAKAVQWKNQSKIGYKQHCTLIETVKKLKKQVFALDDLLGIMRTDAAETEGMEDRLVQTNDILENLLSLMPTVNTTNMDITKIHSLLSLALNILDRDLIKKRRERRPRQILPEVAQAITQEQLFPPINPPAMMPAEMDDVVLIPENANLIAYNEFPF